MPVVFFAEEEEDDDEPPVLPFVWLETLDVEVLPFVDVERWVDPLGVILPPEQPPMEARAAAAVRAQSKDVSLFLNFSDIWGNFTW